MFFSCRSPESCPLFVFFHAGEIWYFLEKWPEACIPCLARWKPVTWQDFLKGHPLNGWDITDIVESACVSRIENGWAQTVRKINVS
jgi:hypothetical protein